MVCFDENEDAIKFLINATVAIQQKSPISRKNTVMCDDLHTDVCFKTRKLSLGHIVA